MSTEFVAGVQANCDLADARHARDLTLCTYLLQMREMCRWEAGLALGAAPDRARIGRWIGEREDLWERLLETPRESYASLPLGSGLDPFDEPAVNAALRADPSRKADSARWVYGAGLGRFGRAEFMLAEIDRIEQRDGVTVTVAGRELARGMNPPLAMMRDAQVLVRADVLRRWLWNRIEVADPFGGVSVDALLPDAIELMIQHELGEHRAAGLLGDDWERMLESIDDARTELQLRSVRDLLADCLVTLPWLLDSGRPLLAQLWWLSFEGLRRVLAPEMTPALQALLAGEASALRALARSGEQHWRDCGIELLQAWHRGGPDAVASHASRLFAPTGSTASRRRA